MINNICTRFYKMVYVINQYVPARLYINENIATSIDIGLFSTVPAAYTWKHNNIIPKSENNTITYSSALR